MRSVVEFRQMFFLVHNGKIFAQTLLIRRRHQHAIAALQNLIQAFKIVLTKMSAIAAQNIVKHTIKHDTTGDEIGIQQLSDHDHDIAKQVRVTTLLQLLEHIGARGPNQLLEIGVAKRDQFMLLHDVVPLQRLQQLSVFSAEEFRFITHTMQNEFTCQQSHRFTRHTVHENKMSEASTQRIHLRVHHMLQEIVDAILQRG
mmetsp:Transcript_16881/g.26224  ORF Transcript_16881/g.26224 Transcript_16881/m.26224 type:complete len:200 (-) Transcript_16881:361-960(-)